MDSVLNNLQGLICHKTQTTHYLYAPVQITAQIGKYMHIYVKWHIDAHMPIYIDMIFIYLFIYL